MGVPEHGTLPSPGHQQPARRVGEGPWSRSEHSNSGCRPQPCPSVPQSRHLQSGSPPALATYIFGDQALETALLLELGKKRGAQRRRPRPRGRGPESAATTGTEGTCLPARLLTTSSFRRSPMRSTGWVSSSSSAARSSSAADKGREGRAQRPGPPRRGASTGCRVGTHRAGGAPPGRAWPGAASSPAASHPPPPPPPPAAAAALTTGCGDTREHRHRYRYRHHPQPPPQPLPLRFGVAGHLLVDGPPGRRSRPPLGARDLRDAPV